MAEVPVLSTVNLELTWLHYYKIWWTIPRAVKNKYLKNHLFFSTQQFFAAWNMVTSALLLHLCHAEETDSDSKEQLSDLLTVQQV